MQETQETWVKTLGREDPLEEEMAIQCSILSWEIPWTEEADVIMSFNFMAAVTICSDFDPPK